MEETSWKNCVPSSYWNTITCYFVKEDGNTVYICTKEGMFIECCNGVIERSCLVNCSNAETIEQLFTYHPFLEYFIVKYGEKLVLISNTKELNVCQEYTGIKKYEIGDYKAQGAPQIKIWHLDDQQEPIITDFSELSSTIGNTSTSRNHDYICSLLQPKVKEAKDLLSTYIKDIESKRKLRSETMLRLVNNFSTGVYLPSTELHCFLGSKSIEINSKTKKDRPTIQLLYPWQMAVNKQWLLGILVKNSSAREICNLKVLLHELPKERIHYTVKRLNSANMSEMLSRLELQTPTMPPRPTVIWQEERMDAKLSPREGCVLISIFPFPDFTTTSTISISGILSYTVADGDEKVKEIYLQEFPQFKITARNVLDGSLLPGGPHKNFFNTISTIAVSELVMLSVSMGMSPTKPLEDILTTDVGFSPIHEDDLYYHHGRINHALSGCVVQIVGISKEEFEMRLYARNHELLVLLVYSILEAFPGSWNVKYCCTKSTPSAVDSASTSTVDQCSDALSKEIMYIISNLSKWKRKHCSNRICIDVNSYSKFRKALSSLQEQTDKVFSNYDLETNKDDQIVYH